MFGNFQVKIYYKNSIEKKSVNQITDNTEYT